MIDRAETAPPREESLAALAARAARGAGGDGFCCPRCGCRHLLAGGSDNRLGRVRRYRYCRHCGHGVVTDERIIREVARHDEEAAKPPRRRRGAAPKKPTEPTE